MTTKDSEIPNVDRGQEQRHLIIRIRCDHETRVGKENNTTDTVYSQISMILDRTIAFPSFPAKHVICRGEEAASSSPLCFINDFCMF